jgi:lipopolysaccharide transport system permease protein
MPGPIQEIIRHSDLIAAMTWRTFQQRYKGTFGGPVWAVCSPLLMITVYTIVFSVFLKIRFGQKDTPLQFAMYLLCGMLPWIALSESLSGGVVVIKNNANLVKRVIFPLEVLPLNLVLASVMQQTIGSLFLLPLLFLEAGRLHWTLLFFPVFLSLQVLLIVGFNWILSSLSVYIPDTVQFMNVLLPLWMLCTPIFYPESLVPPDFAFLLKINPMAGLIKLYRETMIHGQIPGLGVWLWGGIPCLASFFLGYIVFGKLKKGFADVL